VKRVQEHQVAVLPSVFLSHGSPMHALQPGPAGEAWRALGRRLPRPRALLIASAHWETSLPMLTGSARPETIHDFYNFPEPLYRLRYPAPGAPEVAQRAQAVLKAAGFTAAIDGCRGLDHGAWAPLLYAYPEHDVPVVQLSIQPALGPRHHLQVGKALRELAGEGVLILGSGHMTHNLRDWARGAGRRGAGRPEPYAREFQAWVFEKLNQNDVESLVDYRSKSAHGVRAHPTDEHFLPLFIALGAAPEPASAERVYDAIDSGVLAMDAYVFN
jgi:4,5-DOPA dioxygenase extradiol